MLIYYLKMFGISLGLTLIIELLLALILRVRGRGLFLVFLVNLITNPPVVLFSYLASSRLPAGDRLPFQLLLEGIVVLTEGLIYQDFKGNGIDFRYPVLLSLILNAVSYGAGLFLNSLNLPI